jgi:hypothetical protein
VTEKKVVNRNIMLFVGAAFIILIILLAGTTVNYRSILSEKDSQITNLQHQVTSSSFQITDLQRKLSYADSQINSLNSSAITLQYQVSNLTAPSIVWDISGSVYASVWFSVSGSVCNFGTQSAYNATVHVVAYFVNGTKAIDSDVNVGTIQGRTIETVGDPTHADIYFGGGILNQNWVITESWSASP